MLLIESDPHHRERLTGALRAAGVTVTGAGSLVEVDHWPAGDVVVTDVAYFSPWWKYIGASEVVVLADTAGEGVEACRRGATAWVARHGPVATLVTLLDTFNAPHGAPNRTSREAHTPNLGSAALSNPH